MRYELTDFGWKTIKPFLPNKPRGVPRVAVSIRNQIVTALKNERAVWVFAMICKTTPWKGLPVNLVAGLEEGPIGRLRPTWNVRGLAKAST